MTDACKSRPDTPATAAAAATVRAAPAGAQRAAAGELSCALRRDVGDAASLAECLAVAHRHGVQVSSAQPVVLIPSYRNARLQPGLTALLAMALAREGIPVLVHGVLHDGAGTTCAAVLRDLGLAPCQDTDAVHSLWARRAPAFVDAALLCSPSHALFDAREDAAFRHAARRLATLLAPIEGAPSLRLLAAGAEFEPSGVAAWLRNSRAHALLLHGRDPVGDPWRRPPRIEVFIGGEPRRELASADPCATAQRWPPLPPLLPRNRDATTTALYVQEVLSGERPMPAPLARQLALAQSALNAVTLYGSIALNRRAGRPAAARYCRISQSPDSCVPVTVAAEPGGSCGPTTAAPAAAPAFSACRYNSLFRARRDAARSHDRRALRCTNPLEPSCP